MPARHSLLHWSRWTSRFSPRQKSPAGRGNNLPGLCNRSGDTPAVAPGWVLGTGARKTVTARGVPRGLLVLPGVAMRGQCGHAGGAVVVVAIQQHEGQSPDHQQDCSQSQTDALPRGIATGLSRFVHVFSDRSLTFHGTQRPRARVGFIAESENFRRCLDATTWGLRRASRAIGRRPSHGAHYAGEGAPCLVSGASLRCAA